MGKSQTKEDLLWFQNIIRASPYPAAEIFIDEWNSTAIDRDWVHDTAFMAGFLLHNYLSAPVDVEALCYWAVSDRFEEHGPGECEFHGGFGLLTASGFKKPQYFVFQVLKALGGAVLSRGENYIVARSDAPASEVQALFWNYAFYSEEYLAEKIAQDYYDRYRVFEKKDDAHFQIALSAELWDAGDGQGADGQGVYMIEKTVFSREHGSIFDLWLKNGAVEELSGPQKEMLKRQCAPAESFEIRRAESGRLVLAETVPPCGFALLRIRRVPATIL